MNNDFLPFSEYSDWCYRDALGGYVFKGGERIVLKFPNGKELETDVTISRSDCPAGCNETVIATRAVCSIPNEYGINTSICPAQIKGMRAKLLTRMPEPPGAYYRSACFRVTT